MAEERRASGPVVVLGEAALVDGYVLAGAVVVHAETRDEVRQKYQAISSDVGLVILTAAAGRALEGQLERAPYLVSVMPG